MKQVVCLLNNFSIVHWIIKNAILLIYFLIMSLNAYPQSINMIKVPETNCPTLQQALNEFYVYTSSYNHLVLDATAIKNRYGYPVINWSEPMLMWDPDISGPRPYWTAFAIISYAQNYRIETDINRKNIYAQRAKAGCEYLLWLQANSCVPGALPSSTNGQLPTSDDDSFNSSIAGVAFTECYLSFGLTKYLTAALNVGNYILNYNA